jgi:predicted component of type VI protein secretion system
MSRGATPKSGKHPRWDQSSHSPGRIDRMHAASGEPMAELTTGSRRTVGRYEIEAELVV